MEKGSFTTESLSAELLYGIGEKPRVMSSKETKEKYSMKKGSFEFVYQLYRGE
ncbi:hypothetical protein [Salsuginibacillus kocurii]|uniref:hypothetical protein n=1 Tax=Salsuginibacillus kocurii TaxID=427078 RepID=UPI00037AF8E1|nr:hypothetical protein [Salsuginibacillus kocurii]